MGNYQDDCQDNSKFFPPGIWEGLKNIPALRYMKEPVDEVSELYSKYKGKAEKNSFAFVHNKNTFYTYHPTGWFRGEWKPISADSISSLFEIDAEFLKEGDVLVYDNTKEKFVVKSDNIWNKLIDKASSVIQTNKFLNEVEEIPTAESDAGIYFVHKDNEVSGKIVEFRALYIVLDTLLVKKVVKIWNSTDYYTATETQSKLNEKANQTQVNDIAASVDAIAVTKAEKSVVDALMNGVTKQPAVDTYNNTSEDKTSLLSTYPNPNKGDDVLVIEENTRYNWNGEQWVDMLTGSYDEDFAKLNMVNSLFVNSTGKKIQLLVNGDQNRHSEKIGFEEDKIYNITARINEIKNFPIRLYLYKDAYKSTSNDAVLILEISAGETDKNVEFTTTNDYQYIGIYSLLNDGTNVSISAESYSSLNAKNENNTARVGNIIPFDKSKITRDKFVRFVDGVEEERDANGWFYTDFIDIRKWDNLFFSFFAVRGGVLYNDAKVAIGEFSNPNDLHNTIAQKPNGVSFLRWNCQTKRLDDAVIMGGTSGVLSSIDYLSRNIRAGMQNKFTNLLNINNIILGEYAKLDANYTASFVPSVNHYRTDYIDVSNIKLLYVSFFGTGNGVLWYDKDKEPISKDSNSIEGHKYILRAPSNAAFCILNFYLRVVNPISDIVICDAKHMFHNILYDLYFSKRFLDKKMAWYGTSIPAGNPYHTSQLQNVFAYPNRVAALLGANIQNRCVSGGFIISKGNTDYQGSLDKRFTDLSATFNYKNAILDLIGTDLEPDYFIFDWGANDGQFYQSYFDALNLDNLDMTNTDTNTFLGAYNFIIRSLLEVKPSAKIMLCTHYSDDGQSNEMTRTDGYKKMNDLIIKIAEYWHLPVNDVKNKTGWIYGRNGISNIRTFCKDGIHPANGFNMDSINILTDIHYQYVKSVWG